MCACMRVRACVCVCVRTCLHLHFLVGKSSRIWINRDDNTVLEGQPHVLTVDPYVAMDPPCRDRLLSFLQVQILESRLCSPVVVGGYFFFVFFLWP